MATLEQALRKLSSSEQPGERQFGAVIADLHLAGLGAADGMDLLDAVTRWHPTVRCKILATADPIGEVMVQSRGYLHYDKDLPLAVLVGMIRDHA
jgi:hypothetical protein